MAVLAEETITNQLASLERSIAGVKNSYSYSQNPDALSTAMLPAVIHYIPSFESNLKAHHNVWNNQFVVRSILFVASRQSSGGQLKFLENQAIPFGAKWRDKFQADANLTTLFANLPGTVKVYLKSGNYGAGGDLLTYASVEFLGWYFDFDVSEVVGN